MQRDLSKGKKKLGAGRMHRIFLPREEGALLLEGEKEYTYL